MKKMLVAAGISAMLVASSASAFADGAKTDDAPRVVDRLSAEVTSSVEVVVPAKPGAPAPVLATGTYNSLISQATTSAEQQAYADAWRCYPTGCEDFGYNPWPFAGAAVVAAVVVATNDDSESD